MASHHGRAKSGARAILGLSFWSSEVFCQYPKGFHKANYNFIYFNLAVVWLDLAVHTTSGTPPSCAPMPGTCRTWNCWDWIKHCPCHFVLVNSWGMVLENWAHSVDQKSSWGIYKFDSWRIYGFYIIHFTSHKMDIQIPDFPVLNTDGQFNPASF